MSLLLGKIGGTDALIGAKTVRTISKVTRFWQIVRLWRSYLCLRFINQRRAPDGHSCKSGWHRPGDQNLWDNR